MRDITTRSAASRGERQEPNNSQKMMIKDTGGPSVHAMMYATPSPPMRLRGMAAIGPPGRGGLTDGGRFSIFEVAFSAG
jgi:hypothetical protein